jgi:hypothetical protein
MTSLARLRERGVLAAQMAALRAQGESERREFHRGALDALRWLTEGGPGPLTGALGDRPVPAPAVVRELAAAEELIYGRPSKCRDYACGLEHALMWAQFATAAPPADSTWELAPDHEQRIGLGRGVVTPMSALSSHPSTRSART